MKNVMILICGWPGSGKSTLAKKIQTDYIRSCYPTPKIFEADMFFEKDGKYLWNKNDLPKAHNWCFENVKAELEKGNDVIVSNTFLTKYHRAKYFKMAKELNASIKVYECFGNYKNIHNVPDEVVESMKKKFQRFNKNELK